MIIVKLKNFSVLLVLLLTSLGSSITSADKLKKAVMYKPLQCYCCDIYAEYLKSNGFEVEINPLSSLSRIRRMAGVPKGFEGCHTLMVDGYVVDGLVPISILNKLLTEKPPIKGITLPGMPWGAPGMMQRPKKSPLVVYGFEKRSSKPWIYAQE